MGGRVVWGVEVVQGGWCGKGVEKEGGSVGG